MSILDDAETDVIRELELAGVRGLAEKLVSIRKRRTQFAEVDPAEADPWLADFRHIRALAFWRYINIRRRVDPDIYYVHARSAVGGNWVRGHGPDLGAAIDDLILKCAADGQEDFTVGSDTVRRLTAERDPNSTLCEACDNVISEGETVHVDAEGLHFCATCYEHANEPVAGPSVVVHEDGSATVNMEALRADERNANGRVYPRETLERAVDATRVEMEAAEIARDTERRIRSRDGRVSVEQFRENAARLAAIGPTVEEAAQAVNAFGRAAGAAADAVGEIARINGPDGPPGPPTAGEVYAMLEIGDHVVLNGIEYVVAMPCGPGFRSSVQTRPITGGIIEDVTFEQWVAQGVRKRDPAEYMPATVMNCDGCEQPIREGDGVHVDEKGLWLCDGCNDEAIADAEAKAEYNTRGTGPYAPNP